MSRQLAAALLLLTAAATAPVPLHAQILPGDSVDTGVGAAVRSSRSRPVLGLSRNQQQYIYEQNHDYGTGRRNLPPPRPADPWKGMRSTPADYTMDRHRPM